ncbi:MAG: putative dehydrogenase [Verrucomicrobiales bacterium]|jgi:predicted dehydrogenase
MKPNRRQFLKTSSAAVLGFPTIIPRHVLGGPNVVPPSEKVNIGIIGAGGKGKENTGNLLKLDDVQITAIADPAEYWNLADFYYKTEAGMGPVKKMVEAHFSAKTPNYRVSRYEDFRVMLEKESSLDAVVCSTPDHCHAYVSALAMRSGKHVYCEKPLTHNIWEVRQIRDMARETGLATQMGNGGHSSDGIRQTVEYVKAGVIGKVTESHAWVPTSRWTPGLTGYPSERPPVPKGLNWDLWLGPAQERPYHEALAPVKWRDFWAFGCGALGDFGCHDLDAITWACALKAPDSVEILPAGHGDAIIAPYGEIGYYHFPSRGDHPPMKVTWYSGGLKPSHPDQMPEKMSLPRRGILIVGEKGIIQCDGAGGAPRVFPDTLRASMTKPEPTIPRSKGHYRDWVDAIKGGSPASSNFDVAANLTEITLLGVLSLRLGGEKIHWDAANMKAKGLEKADDLIREPARKGWEIG